MDKIGFIGTGFIGGNMADNFKDRGFETTQYSLEEKYIGNKDKVGDMPIVFVAVPTPTKDRKFDDSILIKAIEKLHSLGFDVAIRLSPYIIPFVDTNIINNIKCDKIIVEFLRVNHRIKKRFDIDYTEYTLKEGGYQHLPLDKKLQYLSKITIPQISVCEDVLEHYRYRESNINHNPNDCCNLRV